jgi:hypothetical protein
VPEATACPPSVIADTIMRTIELGVMITDAAVDEKVTAIFCAPVRRDPRCPDCGREGRYRDTVTRPLRRAGHTPAHRKRFSFCDNVAPDSPREWKINPSMAVDREQGDTKE